jgi:hypothetical protein
MFGTVTSVRAVPEPTTLLLSAIGALTLVAVRKRRQLRRNDGLRVIA